jgi:hypothetical protein
MAALNRIIVIADCLDPRRIEIVNADYFNSGNICIPINISK